jgi:thiol-disulfide isomerase/thioredoxin
MRKWFYLLLCFLPMLSCVGQKDDPTPELRLVADLTAINVTAGEFATFTVYSGAEDVTAYAAIRTLTDGTSLEGNVFAPAEAGEWSFAATLDGTESEPVTVTAIVISDEGKDFFRRSLVLDFTGTWCVNCPKMEAAIEESMAARPSRIVPVSVHCMAVDPMYVKPLSDNLVKQFSVKAYPSAVVDLDPESLITTQSPELLLSHVDRLLEARGPAAGIRAESKVEGDQYTLAVEMKAVRDGSYTLAVLVLEDGTVAAQTGGAKHYVHNNILRSWTEGESLTVKEGDKASGTFTGTVTAKSRCVVLVLRDGLVDNVIGCAAGASVDWQYEEDND